MFTTVLPVWGAALLLSVSCWGVGAAVVKSRSPVVAMLAGWCAFLLLCTVPWVLGIATRDLRALFWLFYATGLALTFTRRRWTELAMAALSTAAIVAVLGAPFLMIHGLLAYGAHGTDMWGYVGGAEWLQTHSIRDLPVPGVSPMRFNWTWYVFTTRERPLIYESLSCLASSTGLSVVNAYLAYPVTLIASLAMALAREPRVFRFKTAWLALPFTLAAAMHPLIVLPWIAGYMGGAISGLFIALGIAATALAGEGEERNEALALGLLMILFCAALYAEKLVLVALALGGAEIGLGLLAHVRTHGWRRWPRMRGSLTLVVALAAMVTVMGALIAFGTDQSIPGGAAQDLRTALGHLLGMFGGSSPYVWLGYLPRTDLDTNPLGNPVGAVALVVTFALFAGAALSRWRTRRDLRIPLVVLLCLAVLVRSFVDEETMAKTLALFGFSLLIVLAAVSAGLPRWWLGFLAALVCALPCVRSASQLKELLEDPYISSTTENVANFEDGHNWRIMCYLNFREDKDGMDWQKNPRIYRSMTCFLTPAARAALDAKYGMGGQGARGAP